MKQRYFRIILLILALLFSFSCSSGGSDDNSGDGDNGGGAVITPLVSIFTQDSGTTVVSVELARTQAEQQVGLMNRFELGEFEGMLFLFPNSAVRAFTMENTFIPLDIIFIDDNFRIVGIVRDTIPDTPGPYSVSTPSMYALEVNAGFSQRRGVEVGDFVAFSGFEF